MQNYQKKYQVIADFLRRIQEDGYPMGTGVQLKAQELISRLPNDVALDDLKSYIVPIFARSKDEQDRFQGHFLDALILAKEIDLENLEEIKEEEKPKDNWTKWLYWLLPLLLLPLIVFGIKYFMQGDEIVDETTFNPHIEYFQLEPGTDAFICLDSISSSPEFGVVLNTEYEGNQVYNDSIEGEVVGEYSFDTETRCLEYTAYDLGNKESIILDTIYYTWSNQLDQKILVKYVGEILGKEEADTATIKKDQEVEPEEPEYFQKKIPYNESYQRILADPLTQEQKFFMNNFWWIFPLCGLITLITLILLIREFYFKKEEGSDPTLVAELESKNLPPYVWNIQLDGNGDVGLDEDVVLTLRQLKERANDEGIRLDVASTINKTIKEGGRFTPNYKRFTKFPEYLLLIERRSPTDHRAMLYNNLYQYFKANEILVERYYFNTDIRVCYNDEFKNGIKLTELTKKYGDSRLVIMGSGSYLLNPMSGKLAKWTSIFEEWKERALMTPKTLDTWNRQENRLEELFTVMPTSHQCLSHWAYVLKHDLDWDKGRWKDILPTAQTKKISLGTDISSTLSKHYDESLKIWIAACAVYPSLYWDLTIHLGHFIAEELNDEELVSNANLADMFRLKWFADGNIPAPARADLIAFLQTQHPTLLSKIRENLNEVLQNNQPPVYSVAYDEHRMNIALNQWMLEDDTQKKKELQKEIEKYLHHGIEADFVMIKQISEKQRSALQFEVPKQWNKYVEDDESLLGDEAGEEESENKKKGWLHWFTRSGLVTFFTFMCLLMLVMNNYYEDIDMSKDNCEICKEYGSFAERYVPWDDQDCYTSFNNFNIDFNQLCPKSNKDYLLYLNHYVISEINNGNGFYLDPELKKEIDNLDKYEPDEFYSLMDTIVDAPIKVYKNIAAAYYDKAVEEYYLYQQDPSIYQNEDKSSLLFCKLVNEAYKYDSTDFSIISLMIECGNEVGKVETIKGRVLDRVNRRPVSNASLNVNNTIIQTDGDGNYELVRDSLIKDVVISRDWFITDTISFEQYNDGNIQPEDIFLENVQYVFQVVDVNGRPISDVQLSTNNMFVYAVTDDEGKFTLFGSVTYDEFVEMSMILEGYEEKSYRIFADDSRNPESRKFVLQTSSNSDSPKPNIVNKEGLEIKDKKGKKGLYYVDSNSPADKIVIPAEYDEIELKNIGDDKVFIRLRKRKDFYFFLTDTQGNISLSNGIQGPYVSMSKTIQEDFVIVKLKNKYTYANIYGARMVALFDKAAPFENGKAEVELDGRTFIINTNGECVENCEEDDFEILEKRADRFIASGNYEKALEILETLKDRRNNTAIEKKIAECKSKLNSDANRQEGKGIGIRWDINCKSYTEGDDLFVYLDKAEDIKEVTLLLEKEIIGLGGCYEKECVLDVSPLGGNLRSMIYDVRIENNKQQFADCEILDKKPSSSNVLEPEIVTIPSGTFYMGCQEGRDGNCKANEEPKHQVQINSFKMSKYEVTQVQWREVMGSDPKGLYFKDCDECPVENVSWNEIQEFLKKLNQKTGRNYRLPTESEWEYAARGGQNYKYAGSDNLNDVAWYSYNSDNKTHPVGEKSPNGYGLYDMSGNVYEWCQDKWHDSYEGAPSDGSVWLTEGNDSYSRVLRGGSWDSSITGCRVANRSYYNSGPSSKGIGFRLVQD